MAKPESSKSSDARPPVQNSEMETADDAICPYHRGLISLNPPKEGTVFWCPIGRQYWRFRKDNTPGFTSRIVYPRIGIV